MAINEIHVGDIGLQFRVTIKDENGAVKDISYTTTRQFIFKKPDGTTVTKTALFLTDGEDGILYYNTVDGDLNLEGRWTLQVRLVGTGSDKKTDVARFRVHDNLE